MEAKLGHVVHTWGDAPLEAALAEIAAIGFRGVELFTQQVTSYVTDPPAFGALLHRYGLVLSSLYLPADLVHPALAGDTVDRASAAASFLHALGAGHLIVGEGSGPQPKADFEKAAQALNRMGEACLDRGVELCLHPHMGSIVQTPEQIDRIFALTDPAKVFFCLDTGHVAKGGSDPVETTRKLSSRLRFVHLKDMRSDGRFVELGRGIIDHPAVLALLRELGYRGWILDEVPVSDATAPEPGASATLCFEYLQSALAGDVHG